MDYLIKEGWVFDPTVGAEVPRKLDILVESGTVARVEESLPFREGASVIDASGKLIIPGLVNSHFHSHDHYDRGRFDNLPLELWILFIRPWIGAKPFTPREIYLRTMIGAMEMIQTGTTLGIDDVNLAPFNTLENIGAVMQAYRDAGLRALVSASVFDKPAYLSVPYVADLLPREIRDAMDQLSAGFTAADWLAFLRDCLSAWDGQDGLTRFILGPSAPQRCTDELLLRLKSLAVEFGSLLVTHTLETKVQKVTGPLFYGKSVIAHLDRLGLLGGDLRLVHCVWISEEDLDRIAATGTSVVHCPVSNLKLGSGIAPLEWMLRRGVAIGLGTDNTSCNDSQNLFEVMKFAALLPKVFHSDFAKWPEALDIWRLATQGGAAIAGLAGKAGTLRPGARADLVLLDLKSPGFLPLGRVERNLVYSENGRSVDTVMVNGELVLHHRRLVRVDEAALRAEIIETAERLKKDHRSVYEKAEEIYPYFKEAYDRCHAKFRTEGYQRLG